MTEEDPFAHLHDEQYDSALRARRAGAATLVNAHGRPVQSLDGIWRLTLDPFEEGLRQAWYAFDDTPPVGFAGELRMMSRVRGVINSGGGESPPGKSAPSKAATPKSGSAP
jgi:hypothetical protein